MASEAGNTSFPVSDFSFELWGGSRMRPLACLVLVLAAFSTGCIHFPSSPPFLKSVHVDVLEPVLDQPALLASLSSASPAPGDDLPLRVQISLPPRQMKYARLRIDLYRADSKKPVHSARLSQLRAGDLSLVFSTLGLSPGSHRLEVVLTPKDAPPVTQSLPFTLTSP